MPARIGRGRSRSSGRSSPQEDDGIGPSSSRSVSENAVHAFKYVDEDVDDEQQEGEKAVGSPNNGGGGAGAAEGEAEHGRSRGGGRRKLKSRREGKQDGAISGGTAENLDGRPHSINSNSSSGKNDNGKIGDATGEDAALLLEEGAGKPRNQANSRGTTASGGRKVGGEDGKSGEHRRRFFNGGFWGALRTMLFGVRDPESDLNVEMLEELHMFTGFTHKELRLTRSHFLALVKDSSCITREEFLAIPSVANNPLRERLLVCFGFDAVESLQFKEFVEILSIFNNQGAQREHKLRMAFTLVDINGDGQVSKNDLVRYLELITAAPEGVKVDLNAVAARVIVEGVSTPGGKSLSLADFIKIMGAADFADKLTIHI